MNNEKNYGTTFAAARKGYEASVGIRAYNRAGNNPQLKGIVHEVAYVDAQNFNPRNLIAGTRAALTKSTNAVRDDVVLMNGGKVVGRVQLKDTPRAISDTVAHVASGQYKGTKLIGTRETTEAYSKAVANAAKKGKNISQKMTSSGISSTDTGRVAIETIGEAAGKLAPKAVAKVAASSGLVGAAVSGGVEFISAGRELINDEIDGGEFFGRVAKETASGGLSAAGASALATTASAGAATVLAGTTAAVWGPVAIGVGVTVVAGTAIKKVIDAFLE